MLSKMCLRSFQITPTHVALVSNAILLGSNVISFKFSFASPASLSANLNPMYLQTQTLQFHTSSETTSAHPEIIQILKCIIVHISWSISFHRFFCSIRALNTSASTSLYTSATSCAHINTRSAKTRCVGSKSSNA